MTAVIVNVSRGRIATENDLAKFDIISVLKNHLDLHQECSEKSEEYLRHFAKHLEAITAKLGAPELREAYVPKQKFIFAE